MILRLTFIYVTDATKNPDEQDLNQFKSPISPQQQQAGNNMNNQGFNSNVNSQQNIQYIPNDGQEN